MHGDVSLSVRTGARQIMYRNDLQQTEFVDFYLLFDGKLSTTNRWVKLAGLVHWEKIEACYRQSLGGTGMGAPQPTRRNPVNRWLA